MSVNITVLAISVSTSVKSVYCAVSVTIIVEVMMSATTTVELQRECTVKSNNITDIAMSVVTTVERMHSTVNYHHCCLDVRCYTRRLVLKKTVFLRGRVR